MRFCNSRFNTATEDLPASLFKDFDVPKKPFFVSGGQEATGTRSVLATTEAPNPQPQHPCSKLAGRPEMRVISWHVRKYYTDDMATSDP